MRAIVQRQYGPPEVLAVRELPTPSPGPGQLLVAVHATPVTQGDRRLRAADFPGIGMVIGRLMFGITGPRSPIPGTVFAGRVVETGAGVTGFAVGDDVYGIGDNSAAAERLVVDAAGAVAHIPSGVSYVDAAAVPYGALTAHIFLRDKAPVSAGQRVLVVGASGGVGRFVVQLAKHAGAHVTAVAGSSRGELLAELGADVVVDYRSVDVTQGDDKFDLIFDTSGALGFRGTRRILTATGRFVSLYMTAVTLAWMALTALTGGRRALTGVSIPTPTDLAEVTALLASGAIDPVIAETFPLDRAVAAHALAEPGRSAGAIVITPVTGVRGAAPGVAASA
ncbi:MAG: NADPH:quinone reductase-like Zn-dependent oxidoreductase [Myxococcota bacterium]|jgi:NADPH:quinone reductase-like Zn-dependent oxidoreductase